MRVCISSPNILRYPQGGHLWVFLNWAYGFSENGCEVHLLDIVDSGTTPQEQHRLLSDLQSKIPFPIAIGFKGDEGAQEASIAPIEEYDFLLDMRYDTPDHILRKAKTTAIIDIDPGQLQAAIKAGIYPRPIHDILLSIGNIPEWEYIPPVVAIEQWPAVTIESGYWTTIAHWWADNSAKREAFQDYMKIPGITGQRFRLALSYLTEDEQSRIESCGFSVVDAHRAVSTPLQYKDFIQKSLGEFSVAKKWYVEHPMGWISDRSLCYLATGKPCIVQYTGEIPCIPGHKQQGLVRFTSPEEAIKAIREVRRHYQEHCSAARDICIEHFSSKKICAELVSRVIA